jgi:hypothetical protein
MKHEEEVKSNDYIYYLVGLLSGLFIGACISFIWIPILGVVGLLFAAFFLAVFVRGGRGEKA